MNQNCESQLLIDDSAMVQNKIRQQTKHQSISLPNHPKNTNQQQNNSINNSLMYKLDDQTEKLLKINHRHNLLTKISKAYKARAQKDFVYDCNHNKSYGQSWLSRKSRRLVDAFITKLDISMENLSLCKFAQKGQYKALMKNVVQKMDFYQKLLNKSAERLMNSPEEQQLCDQNQLNCHIRNQIQRDTLLLKQICWKYQFSIFRKAHKSQEKTLKTSLQRTSSKLPKIMIKKKSLQNIDLGAVQKNANTKQRQLVGQQKRHRFKQEALDSRPQGLNEMIKTEPVERDSGDYEMREIDRRQQLSRSVKYKLGNDYLEYSKHLGRSSKVINKKLKGSIKFVKQIVHNWWFAQEKDQIG